MTRIRILAAALLLGILLSGCAQTDAEGAAEQTAQPREGHRPPRVTAHVTATPAPLQSLMPEVRE